MGRIAMAIQSRFPGAIRHGLVMLTLLTVLTGQVSAETAESAGKNEQSAEYWLNRLGPALNMTSYRGVFVYARGDQVSSMQIAHRYRDGMVEERLYYWLHFLKNLSWYQVTHLDSMLIRSFFDCQDCA